MLRINKVKDQKTVLLVSDMGKFGGTEVATLVTAKVLKKNDIKVIVLGKDGPLVKSLLEEEILFYDYDTHSRKIIKNLSLLYVCYKLLKKYKINIIHAQMARPVPLLWLAKFFAGNKGKIFWTSRGILEHTYKIILPIFRLINIKIIGNCKQEQRKIIGYGYPPKLVSYAYNAYRLESNLVLKEKNISNVVRIGTLSALRLDRRIDLFLDIIEKITELNPTLKIQYYIGGDGPEKNNLEKLARDKKIKNIKFLGNINDVANYFNNLDVFVSSVVTEGATGAGISNAIVEAMLTKTPVCAFDAAAIGEIVINNQTGHLVEPRNTEAMAKAILQTIEDKEQTQVYVENAYDLIIKECDPQNYAKKLISLYEEL